MNPLEVLNSIENNERQSDCFTLFNLIKACVNEAPKVWQSKLIGFGSYHYKYESGREGDWFLTGFSSTKKHISIYIVAGVNNYPNLLSKLGKFKTGASCIYVKRLSDINLEVLKQLILISIKDLKSKYPD
tara:strand:- start:384 stop:773 length:390 start_codon:yes stop_codon:yes gene_type:complete